MRNEIKSRLFVHKRLWSIPYRLIIEGFEGHGRPSYGGRYKFVATYLSTVESNKRNEITLDNWCKQNNIPFVYSNSFEELTEKLRNFNRPELKELHEFN